MAVRYEVAQNRQLGDVNGVCSLLGRLLTFSTSSLCSAFCSTYTLHATIKQWFKRHAVCLPPTSGSCTYTPILTSTCHLLLTLYGLFHTLLLLWSKKKNSVSDLQSDGCITNNIPSPNLLQHPYRPDSVTLKMETGCYSDTSKQIFAAWCNKPKYEHHT